MILKVKRKILKTCLYVLVFGAIGIWYSYINFYPLWEFQRLGQFQFPLGTSVESWSENDFSLTGDFKIDSSQGDSFIKDLNLQKKMMDGKEVFSTNHCYNEDKNRIIVNFDHNTSLVKIKIETPDMSGDKPCGPQPEI